MKKAIILILLAGLSLSHNFVFAADTKYEITGTVTEDHSGAALSYVTVALRSKLDSSLVSGTISNEEGAFILEKIVKGDYYLELSFVGYEDYVIDDLSFDNAARTVDIGMIKMNPALELLGEVEVSSKVSPISNSISKQVLSVDRNILATGGTAIDALRLSPSIQLDTDGNVMLRGSYQFTVLVNGKPSTLPPDAVLRQIPAGQINKIEVITNPSVKYAASGGAGIINIILKKGVNSGFNGLINATAGTRGKYSGDISLNLNREKVSLSAGIEFRDWQKTARHNYYRDLFSGDTVHHAIMRQDRLMTDQNLGFRFGLDYRPNDKNNLSYSFHSGYSSTEGDIRVKTSGISEPADISKYGFNTFYILQKPTFYTNNLTFTRQLKKQGSSFSVNTYYSYIDYYLLTSQVLADADQDYGVVDTQPYLQDILNDNYSHDLRVDADYTYPFSEKITLETGASVHNYSRFLDITYAQFDYDTGHWADHPDYTNKYDFSEKVYAAYANVNTSFLGINASIGVRAEYMDRFLRRHEADSGYLFDQLNFFPAFSFSKVFQDRHSLKLAMSNRINRPDEYMMNPFPEFEDDYFYAEGNPYLIPEIVRNVELGYQFAGEKTVVTSNLYYRQTTDKIDQRLWIGAGDKIHTSMYNDSRDRSIGLETMGNFTVTPWWSLNLSTNIFHYTIEGNIFDAPYKRSQVSWTAQMVNSFNITGSTSLQLIGYYNSETARSQGTLSDFYFVDMAVKQDFLNGKLSLNVQVKDLFQTLNYELRTETGNMNLLGDFNNESPILLFNISFQISNYKKKTRDVQTEFDM